MSAKKRDRRQKRSRKKRRSSDQRSAKSIVLDRIKKSGQVELVERSDVEKMSEVILQFAEPLTEAIPDEDDNAFKNAISFAIISWNASLLPAEEREAFIEQMADELAGVDAQDYATLLQIVDMLLERKQKLFYENYRFIIDCQVKITSKTRQLYVVSTLDQKEFNGKLAPRKAKKPWWKRIFPW